MSRDDGLNELRFSTYEEQERSKKGLHLFHRLIPSIPPRQLIDHDMLTTSNIAVAEGH